MTSKAHQASTIHRPSHKSEEERITKMGGKITDMSVPRVEGKLAISRYETNSIIC
jgi:hypothetical protein